jgi:hypothetical protein
MGAGTMEMMQPLSERSAVGGWWGSKPEPQREREKKYFAAFFLSSILIPVSLCAFPILASLGNKYVAILIVLHRKIGVMD